MGTVRNISFITPYDDEARRLVHRVKAGNTDAVRLMAEAMAEKVPSGSVIVPMPSHNGYPSYSLLLAFEICRLSGAVTWAALCGTPRVSQYETKKAGGLLHGDDFGFALCGDATPVAPGKVVIIDDVIGTGETVRAALKVLPQADIVAYSMDIRTYYNHNNKNAKI